MGSTRGSGVRVRAVTFDFFNTLVHHRTGQGRGARYIEYLSTVGLASDPWEHRVLYDVFEYYGAAYRPDSSDEDKRSFWIGFTRRLFARTCVHGPEPVDPAPHADTVRTIMGPDAFVLFDESLAVLRDLRKAGLDLGVISDWQKGLRHFCTEMGIGACLDVVVASAEVGYQKPDPRLFEVAREGLGLAAHEILHVGDRCEDVDGARAAGFSATRLVRHGEPPPIDVPVIASLGEIASLI